MRQKNIRALVLLPAWLMILTAPMVHSGCGQLSELPNEDDDRGDVIEPASEPTESELAEEGDAAEPPMPDDSDLDLVAGLEEPEATGEFLGAKSLLTGKLDSHFGAAGKVTDLPDINDHDPNPFNPHTFTLLKGRGVRRVRAFANLSDARYATWGPTAEKIASMAELFVTLYIAHCTRDPRYGCYDLRDGDARLDEDAETIREKFEAHFQKVVDVVNPALPDGTRPLNARLWSINEPDLDMNNLSDWPERAAIFYAGARAVLDRTNCPAPTCKVVAAEFSGNYKLTTNSLQRYDAKLRKLGQHPEYYALHPYSDVNRVHYNTWRTAKAPLTDEFAKQVASLNPRAHVWLTEVGRQLHLTNVTHTSPDEYASGRFVRERLLKNPLVTRVYWYQMAASKPGTGRWDSALSDTKGNLRTSYFGLLGYSYSTALAKAKAAGSDPRPQRPL